MNTQAQIKVAGVTFEGRQELLADIATAGLTHPGELKAEPENQFDPMATAVFCRGARIGYLPRGWRALYPDNVTAEIEQVVKDGRTVSIQILKPEAGRTIGARVIVEFY